MTTPFEKTVSRVIEYNERGYSNRKTDSGGETMYGITAKTAKACGYNGKMCDLPKQKAIDIYYTNYWKKSGANQIEFLSFNIAFLLFDFAVNAGVVAAVKTLQKAINKTVVKPLLKTDGIYGKLTNQALIDYSGSLNLIEKLFIAEILRYYTALKNAQTGFQKNGAGWVNRVANNLEFLGVV